MAFGHPAGQGLCETPVEWVHEDGQTVRNLIVTRTVMTVTQADLNGDDIGTARYVVASRELEVLDP